jgi:nucleolar protein 6
MKQGERKDKKDALKKGDKDESKSEADNFGMNPARLAMMQKPAAPAYRQRY